MNASALRVLDSDLGRGALSSASSSASVKGKGKERVGTGIVLGFGESDEYSFCFARGCQAYKRRARYDGPSANSGSERADATRQQDPDDGPVDLHRGLRLALAKLLSRLAVADRRPTHV